MENFHDLKQEIKRIWKCRSVQIANFKPQKGLRTSPSIIYLSTPPPPSGYWTLDSNLEEQRVR